MRQAYSGGIRGDNYPFGGFRVWVVGAVWRGTCLGWIDNKGLSEPGGQACVAGRKLSGVRGYKGGRFW